MDCIISHCNMSFAITFIWAQETGKAKRPILVFKGKACMVLNLEAQV